MLYMAIMKWKPEKFNEIIKRRAEKGRMDPEGLKLIGEWNDVGSGRYFCVVECDDHGKIVSLSNKWADLAKMEFVPVLETEDTLKLI